MTTRALTSRPFASPNDAPRNGTAHPLGPVSRSSYSAVRISRDHDAPALPRTEAAFRAVEMTLESLGIDRPHTLRSPQIVEEALDGASALDGTLVILDPAELRAAELDLEETVADERNGGTLFLSVPNSAEWTARRVRYRDIASSTTAFAFVEAGAAVKGFGKLIPVPRPRLIKGWRVFLADTPGFRVVIVSRPRASGGFIGLWSGNSELVDEVAEFLRQSARDAGHDVADAAQSVPPMIGVAGTAEVWKMATELRGLREIREGELREIARAAALRGVAMRRERARVVGAAAKAPAA